METNTLIVVPYFPRVEDHLALANHVAQRFVRHGRIVDSDEYQDACLGLHRAVLDFIPERGEECWSSFACTYMRNEIVSGYRSRQGFHTGSTGLEYVESRPESDLPEVGLVDKLIASPPGESEDDAFNRELLISHFLKAEKIKDLAMRHGVTREAIYQRIRRAARRIQEAHSGHAG